MTCWPVIVRELRAEARHARGAVLRMLGATVFMGVFWVFMSSPPASGTEMGRRLFSALNCTLFVSLWICVPLLTADCISREKREETLGLLFLTPLSARGIVIGKSLIQALRGLTLVLSAMPVLVLPFLYGGIVWQDAVLALVIHLSALGAGLAAGLIASCLTREHVRSFIVAEILGLLFCIAFSSLLNAFFEMELGELLLLPMGWIKPWGDFPASLHSLLRVQAGVVCLMSMTLVVLVVFEAARQVDAFWREDPASSVPLRSYLRTSLRTLGVAALVAVWLIIALVFWSDLRLASAGFFGNLNALFFASLWLVTPVLTVNRFGRSPLGEAAQPFLVQQRGLGVRSRAGLLDRCLGWLGLLAFFLVSTMSLASSNLLLSEIFFALMLNCSAAVLAFGAARIALARYREYLTSLVWAGIGSCGLAFLFLTVQGLAFIYFFYSRHAGQNWQTTWNEISVWQIPYVGFVLSTGLGGVWATPELSSFQADQWFRLGEAFWLLILSSFLLLALALPLARYWERTRRIEIAADSHSSLARSFCQPLLARASFNRRMRQVLERNPISWLHQYSWSARLTKWGWCLTAVIAECWFTFDLVKLLDFDRWLLEQNLLISALLMGLAFAASGSFRREKQSGVLELLLVSPLSVQQIIRGRLIGLASQFIPALAMVWIFSFFAAPAWQSREPTTLPVFLALSFVSAFFSLSLFGFYFSLRFRSTLVCWFLTCFGVLAIPALGLWIVFANSFEILQGALQGLAGASRANLFSVAFFVCLNAVHVLLGALGWKALKHCLNLRQFALSETLSLRTNATPKTSWNW